MLQSIKRRHPLRRSELLNLREGYLEAAGRGFNPLVCERQIVQVGFHPDGDGLKPPMAVRSHAFDEYIATVQPSRVVQINVLDGSSAAPGFLDAHLAGDAHQESI